VRKLSLTELTSAADPAWPQINDDARRAGRVEVLPALRANAQQVLVGLQVTNRSTLGAIALESGGLLIDDGWLRILGSGSERMPRDLVTWNGLDGAEHRLPGALLVADDAVGGFFAINGGAFDGEAGNVFYRAPDTLEWEDLERGLSDFVDWAFTGDLEKFYSGMQWPNWRADASRLSGNDAFSIWPPLAVAGPPIGERSRKVIPVAESWDLLG